MICVVFICFLFVWALAVIPRISTSLKHRQSQEQVFLQQLYMETPEDGDWSWSLEDIDGRYWQHNFQTYSKTDHAAVSIHVSSILSCDCASDTIDHHRSYFPALQVYGWVTNSPCCAPEEVAKPIAPSRTLAGWAKAECWTLGSIGGVWHGRSPRDHLELCYVAPWVFFCIRQLDEREDHFVPKLRFKFPLRGDHFFLTLKKTRDNGPAPAGNVNSDSECSGPLVAGHRNCPSRLGRTGGWEPKATEHWTLLDT